MARTCILHIGTTKTGSTSIQRVLRAAGAWLADQGACYPDTGADIGHRLLASMFASDTLVFQNGRGQMWQGRDSAQATAAYAEQFAAEMRGLPAHIDRVLISAEQLSQYVRKPEEIGRLHAMLSAFFDDFKVVVYLRRQDSHYASTHAQSLRMGKMRAPDLRQLRSWYHDYDYAELIGRWSAVFGKQALRPRVFDRLSGGDFDVIDDFCGVCGLLLPAEAREVGRARNVSMNRAGQRILLQAGESLRCARPNRDADSLATWQRISRAVSEALPGTGWQPTRAEAAAFMERFADSNEAVRRDWFAERESLFHPGFDHLPESAPPVDTEADFRAACAVIVEVAREAVRHQQGVIKARAHAARRADDPAAYRFALLKAVKLDGADVAARVRLARLQIEEGAVQSARQNLAVALRLAPDHVAARNLMRRLNRAQREAHRSRPAQT